VFKADTWGSRIDKDHKHSTGRIDLAVATLMAFERACWYAQRSAPMIYIPT